MKDSTRAITIIGLLVVVASFLGAGVIIANGGPDGNTEVSLFWAAILFFFNYPVMASAVTLTSAFVVILVTSNQVPY